MSADPHPRSIALADLTSPEGPDLAPAAGGLPAGVSASKSFGSSTCSYGRGKGLSIAAPCNNMSGQEPVPLPLHRVTTPDHLGTHLGVNRGSFKAPHTPTDVVGGGRRG